MKQAELDEVLRLHKMWLENAENGARANLSDADLRRANLRGANLRGANLRHANLMDANLMDANLSGANLMDANLSGADLRHADLSGADLRHADLSRADLRGAGLDYSCLPLWCGSLKANFDDKQATQILYHLLSIAQNSTNISDELREVLLTDSLIEQANQFHRVKECGAILAVKSEIKENEE